MMLVKPDRPRRIDEFIDYFGERPAAETHAPGPYDVAADDKQPRRDEAA